MLTCAACRINPAIDNTAAADGANARLDGSRVKFVAKSSVEFSLVLMQVTLDPAQPEGLDRRTTRNLLLLLHEEKFEVVLDFLGGIEEILNT